MKVLVLTLGHNASAILVEDGNILCGYEEERLTGIKSDSQFPIHAIQQIQRLYDFSSKYLPICVGHWFLEGQLPMNDPKHWQLETINQLFPNSGVWGLEANFSHHDSHMLSAEVFVGDSFPEDHHTLVVDGFGTHGECLSMYYRQKLIYREYGFHRSLGLLYQYATAYMGMKMHQDEYKCLGYETHIHKAMDSGSIDLFNDTIEGYSYQMRNKQDRLERNLSVLPLIQGEIDKKLNSFIQGNNKVLVSYFVQHLLEEYLKDIVRQFNPTNLVLAGGVFYNVKVNSIICDMVPGKFSVMPLAGDQGAGLGVYQHYFKDLKWPGHLFCGHRDIMSPSTSISGIFTRDLIDDGYKTIRVELKRSGIINLIQGSMEFGPRALTHTSTLAIPTMKNVDLINKMNGRDTIMPMALMVTEDQVKTLFEDIDKVHKSLDYMIMTRKFKPGMHNGLEGGALYYPLTDEWTCRPQIVHDPEMINLLNEFGPLINTSANVHGQPIVWDQKQIQYMHEYQRQVFPISTIIINEETKS